jgi:excinuclease UvrABC nuclease subunit
MTNRTGRTALYRMYGAEDLLLYIGISKSFGIRWSAHARTQPWWPQAVRQTIDWYATWNEAKAAETAAIGAERPKYNVAEAHQTDPWANLRIAALRARDQ